MGKPIEVLIVDDDEAIRRLVETGLGRHGLSVTSAANGEVLQDRFLQRFDVLVLDQNMPGPSGLEILNDLRPSGRAPEVIMVTGYPTVETAVTAMKSGAFDFLSKPFQIQHLAMVVRKAAEQRRLKRENSVLRSIMDRHPLVGPIVSDSPQLKAILEQIETIAPHATPVLITGETGTGKGLLAKTLHQMSDRADAPFLQVNCSALQEQLFESELFGYKKGSFTGATNNKLGLFEVTDGGTLFLDEIAEMSPTMQSKLLQVLDSGEVRPVGGTTIRTVDVRIVAATNRDLDKDVETKRFRSDLLYRLNVVGIQVPPLRERREDIAGLVRHYLERFQLRGRPAKQISHRALDIFQNYRWPGNVRELANVVENLILLAPEEVVRPQHLPSHLRPGGPVVASTDDAPMSLSEVERLHIIRTLEFTKGLKARAAKILKIDIKTLNRKIKAYGISPASPANRAGAGRNGGSGPRSGGPAMAAD